MFVTKNQIYVFIACIAFGGLCGIILSAISAIKYFVKNKYLIIIIDVFSWAFLGVLFSIYSYILNFPNFRFYMLAGVFISIVAYFKSFHIILAKRTKKLYNKIIEKFKLKRTEDDRKKVQKSSGRKHGRRSASISNVSDGDGVSVDIH